MLLFTLIVSNYRHLPWSWKRSIGREVKYSIIFSTSKILFHYYASSWQQAGEVESSTGDRACAATISQPGEMPGHSTLAGPQPQHRGRMTSLLLGGNDSSFPCWWEGRDRESMWRKAPQRHLFIFRKRDYTKVDSVKITFFLISHIRHSLQRRILQWGITCLLLCSACAPWRWQGRGLQRMEVSAPEKPAPKGHFKEKSIPVGVVCKLYKLLPLEY